MNSNFYQAFELRKYDMFLINNIQWKIVKRDENEFDFLAKTKIQGNNCIYYFFGTCINTVFYNWIISFFQRDLVFVYWLDRHC